MRTPGGASCKFAGSLGLRSDEGFSPAIASASPTARQAWSIVTSVSAPAPESEFEITISTERGAADDVGLVVLLSVRVKQRIAFVDVAVRPAIDRGPDDVGAGSKPPGAKMRASHPNPDRLVERTYAHVAADVDHRVRMDGAVIGAGRIDICDTERLERAPIGERDRGVDERRLDQRMQRLAAGRAFPDRDRGSCSSSRRAPRRSHARCGASDRAHRSCRPREPSLGLRHCAL